MHIIFGKEQAEQLSNKYTVLELDTFQFGKQGPVMTAYCTVETIPFEELAVLAQIQRLHADLMINYGLRRWEDCLKSINQLRGRWRGELDSFYQDLQSRIQGFVINPPPADWSPVLLK